MAPTNSFLSCCWFLRFCQCLRFAFGEAAPSGKLLKIVALSRHGVRSPTQSDKTLACGAPKTWPSWPVKRGDSRLAAFELVRAMWQNMRARMHDQGLLKIASVRRRKVFFVRSDIDERDQATSRAILEGPCRQMQVWICGNKG